MSDLIATSHFEELRTIMRLLEPITGTAGDPSPAQMVGRAVDRIEELERENAAFQANCGEWFFIAGERADRIEELEQQLEDERQAHQVACDMRDRLEAENARLTAMLEGRAGEALHQAHVRSDELRAENARLRKPLEHISRMQLVPDDELNRMTLVAAVELARDAVHKEDASD
jgi:hypothetical protein